MTHHITTMLQTHPAQIDLDTDALAECIAACVECAQMCPRAPTPV